MDRFMGENFHLWEGVPTPDTPNQLETSEDKLNPFNPRFRFNPVNPLIL